MVRQYRIDADHSNAFETWKRMESPAQPTTAQYAQLEKAGQLALVGNTETVMIENGKATLSVALPRQAVALLILEP